MTVLVVILQMLVLLATGLIALDSYMRGFKWLAVVGLIAVIFNLCLLFINLVL